MSPELIDIGPAVWLASKRQAEWDRSMASIVAWSGALFADLELRWDPGAGESWIVLVSEGGRIVGMVNVKIPLVLSAGPGHAWPYPLVVVDLPGAWGDATLEVLDPSPELAALLDGLDELLKAEPDGFSAQDLWYFTV